MIVGAETQKILFLGIRNKFCFACANPKKKKVEHLCFKNYNGPSTGMETSVIVEGFRRSEEDYGLLYRNYIGDGDSSVYARIQEGCPYGRYVKKVECANHVTRALNDNLHKLADDTKYPLETRKLLSKPAPNESIPRLERIVKGVRTAIKEAGVTKSSQDILNLRHDLRNTPDHVFGKHDQCRSFCTRKTVGEENVLPHIDVDFLCKIRALIGNMESKCDSLVFNQTTNVAERYMGCVAKFTGGKRINFTTGGSFRQRCFGAGLAHTTGPSWHLSPWKRLKNRSPGEVFRKKIISREKRRMKRKMLFSGKKSMKRKRKDGTYDKEYGPLAVKADIEEEEMKEKSETFFQNLKDDIQYGNEEWERKTVGQHKNELWFEKRMNRLTASKFGAVAKRLPHTSCHNMVKSILYARSLTTEAITFGRDHEEVAIKLYENTTGNSVAPCGLFIDTSNPFLGASPDGLVGDDGIVEVKCLASVKEETLSEAVKAKKKLCLEITKEGVLQLKKSHNYHYQIQGQLAVTNRNWCDFVVYTKKGELFVERIKKDTKFWTNEILPKLTRFYNDCLLPEILDSRIVRGMKVRDPIYILEAQKKRMQNKMPK